MEKDENAVDRTVGSRLERILSGAFSGSPTPLKDIPKANGDVRAPREGEPQRGRRMRRKVRIA